MRDMSMVGRRSNFPSGEITTFLQSLGYNFDFPLVTNLCFLFRANTERYSRAVGTLASCVRGRGFESWL